MQFALTGNFDAVFYGHSHQAKSEIIRNTLLLNPGTLMNYNPLKPDENTFSSFAVFDTVKKLAEFFSLND